MGLFPGFLAETGLEYFFEGVPPLPPIFGCILCMIDIPVNDIRGLLGNGGYGWWIVGNPL
jgi:hypothetical protein